MWSDWNDKIKYEYVRGFLIVVPVTEKIKSCRLIWYGHVMRRDNTHATKKALGMTVNGYAEEGGLGT